MLPLGIFGGDQVYSNENGEMDIRVTLVGGSLGAFIKKDVIASNYFLKSNSLPSSNVINMQFSSKGPCPILLMAAILH